MSKIGLVLCFAYLGITALCAAFAIDAFASGDTKGWYVFMQLPLAFQIALRHQLNLTSAFHELGWVSSYLLIGTPTLIVLYWAGWLLEKVSRLLMRLLSQQL